MCFLAWDQSGGGGTKFIPADMSGVGGPISGSSHRKFTASAPFTGPPPPLHSMNMMPPRHPAMYGTMPPPPLLHSMNPPPAVPSASAQFGPPINTYGIQNGAPTIQQTAVSAISEDSIWQGLSEFGVYNQFRIEHNL